MKKTLIIQLSMAAVLGASSYAAPIYNANEAFAATPTSVTFGNGFSVGTSTVTGLALTNFAPFQVGSAHFLGNPDIEGFFINNNAKVPAAVVNTASGSTVVGFGISSLFGYEMLLHPGGLSDNAFDQPYLAATLHFAAPAAGYYTYAALFRSLDSGTTLNGVYINGLSSVLLSSTDADSNFSGSVFLNAADTIDFAVSDFDGISNDSTGLFASVNVPDSGSTMLLLGASMLGMMGMAHLRRNVAA